MLIHVNDSVKGLCCCQRGHLEELDSSVTKCNVQVVFHGQIRIGNTAANFLVCPTSQSNEGTNGHHDLQRRLKAGHKVCSISQSEFCKNSCPDKRSESHGPQFRKCSSRTNYNSNACERVAHSDTLWDMTFPDWHLPRHHHNGGDILESGMRTMLPRKGNTSQGNTTPAHVRP